MDQIYSQALTMLVGMTEPKPAPAKSRQTEDNSFQRMMDQRRQETAPKAEKPQESDENAPVQREDAPAVNGEDSKDTELRMAWAAMALTNPPVVLADHEVPTVTAVVPTQEVPQTVEAVTDAGVNTERPIAKQSELPQEITEQPADAVKVQTDPKQTVEAPKTETVREPQTDTREKLVRPLAEHDAPRPEEELDRLEVTEDPRPIFRDTEAIPVKVAEAPAAEQTEAAKPVEQQLAGKLTQALHLGESRVELQLTPANLGTVQVELTRGDDGVLHIVLNAARAETRDLLARHMSGLQGMLTSQGQETVQVEVQRQQESQSNQSYDGRNGADQGQNGQRQEQRQRHSQHGQDFLQQLRLGLIPVDAAAD